MGVISERAKREAEEAEHVNELWGVSACEFCGEPLKRTDEVGEFYNPEDPPEDVHEHKIGHAQCGLDAKWETA